MEFVWDTTRVGEAEQFVYWRDVVWEAFVPVSMNRPEEGAFPSSVAAHSVGPIGLSRICSQAQSVSRTQADITRATGGVYFLNLPFSDGTSASQRGRVAHLRAGDFTIVDSEHPFSLQFSHSFTQISLAIPKELLSPMLESPLDATAARVPGHRGVGAVAAAEMREIATKATNLGRRDAHALSDHLVNLIALAMRGLRRRPALSTELLRKAASDEIDASLHDHALVPEVVATRLSISVRYLHKLFADQGTTFGRWLLYRRLEASRTCLEDSSWDDRTITEVATRHGFTDPAYFARAFKKAYHLTPTEYRRHGRHPESARLTG
ncbi:MAG TPA: helix-turn-helix domain-containing protein [Acidimicrobiales bacterium]|nr:helix-turn-helix domain-containing protein [Acidimicrobiales bacterium]